MADQATSIVKRLCEAETPHRFHDWEQRDGYYIAACRVSADDVPDLIEMARQWADPEWPSDDFGLDVDWEEIEMLPVTAWRTLADLKSSESVEPLMNMLSRLEGDVDDWTQSELPHVFGKIGEPAIDALVRLARDTEEEESIRSIAAEGLHRVADYHPETRDQVVACLAQMMSEAATGDIEVNSILLDGLVELRAVEAAEAIERAFANDSIDVGMIGDWEDVRKRLGVEGLGLEMPRNPHSSIESFRRRMGIGIFSSESIFDDGDLDDDAAQAYYERAWDRFSTSPQAKQIVQRFGDLEWFQMLLEFGLHYRGEIIDEMTIGSVGEFILEHVPRKVSTEPDRAISIVQELTMFWEFIDRVYGLPNAKSIIEWLKTDGLVERLETELSDPTNFGMAKSMVMTGKNAGYDMTTEEGLAEFMAAYNQSLTQDAGPAPAAKLSRGQKIGRNDPCPCGSGKKFKKCCR